MFEDLKQRIPFYLSDFYDGFVGEKTLHKTISATIFLYFACILPAIAFGVLNLHNTGKYLNKLDIIFNILMLMMLNNPRWKDRCYGRDCGSDDGWDPVLGAGGPTPDRDHDHGAHRALHQDHRGRGRGGQQGDLAISH